MTTFVQALDPRFTMAAPSCYVTSWKRNIENELPADIEQMPPGILGSGCEMGDLVLAYAPRPLLLLGQKNDFFDPRGIAETYEECRKVYKLLGAEENLQLFIGPTDHGYSVENRESMYKFFDLHAGIGKDASEVIGEVDVSTPPVSELCCAPGGQVVNLPGKKLVHDLVTEKLDEFAAGRKKADCAALKKLLTDSGLPLYGAALRRDTVDARTVDYTRCAIAIGSEGKGLSSEMLEACDKTVLIPMSDHCESLNAAIAASVLLWEAARGDA